LLSLCPLPDNGDPSNGSSGTAIDNDHSSNGSSGPATDNGHSSSGSSGSTTDNFHSSNGSSGPTTDNGHSSSGSSGTTTDNGHSSNGSSGSVIDNGHSSIGLLTVPLRLRLACVRTDYLLADQSACVCSSCYLLSLTLSPEVGDVFLRKAGISPNYTALYLNTVVKINLVTFRTKLINLKIFPVNLSKVAFSFKYKFVLNHVKWVYVHHYYWLRMHEMIYGREEISCEYNVAHIPVAK
jgi:hypothetical protein